MWHYVLTIEIPGYGSATTDRTLTARPGLTRETVYRAAVQALVRQVAGQIGADPATLPPPIVRVWALEPNDLA